MSKGVTIRIDLVVRLLFLIVVAFLVIIPGVNYLVLAIFVPVVAWVVWQDAGRISELEKKLAALEKLHEEKPGSS